MWLAGLGPPFRAQPPEAAGVGLVIAQQTQAGAGDSAEGILAVLAFERVLAVAKKREMVFIQPQQKTSGLDDLLRIDPLRQVSL